MHTLILLLTDTRSNVQKNAVVFLKDFTLNIHIHLIYVSFVIPTGLSLEEVRKYEQAMQEKTNSKVKSSQNNTGELATPDLYCTEIPQWMGGETDGGRKGGGGGGERIQLDVRAVKVKRARER